MNKFTSFLEQNRLFITIIHDLFMIFLSIFIAYLFRFNFSIDLNSSILSNFYYTLFPIILIEFLIFLLVGVHKCSWRYVSIKDLITISFGSLLSFIIIFGYDFFVDNGILVSVYFLQLFLLIILCCISRIVVRLYFEKVSFRSPSLQIKRTLIIGTERDSVDIAKILLKNPQFSLIGFVDNSSFKNSREILGIKILGNINLLKKLCTKYSINTILLPSSYANYSSRRNILKLCSSLHLDLLSVPSIDDVVKGKFKLSHFENFSVDDLLGRKPVYLDHRSISDFLGSEIILITGAGGSIGSQIFRDILSFNPKSIICLDNSEYSLYKLQSEFTKSKNKTNVSFIVSDIKDENRMNHILKRNNPTIVFHAAAYKHVPLMEKENIYEALNNNAYGTYVLSKACIKANVKKFILISTDKAINPTNVMGASKRLAEIFCQLLQKKNSTDFITVRFGNVLGSSGSVIPLFKKQIESGGPITITHKDITRFFMSIPEAAKLVLQASVMAKGGEIYVLDMGEPVKILNLAKDMINLAGMSKHDIQIKYTGLREGEKLFEELLADSEKTMKTHHEKIRIALSNIKPDKISLNNLVKWIKDIHYKDELLLKKEIKKWVKEYKFKN
jgi:FlaA1/EpsC-like NDP-sugar epimerase